MIAIALTCQAENPFSGDDWWEMRCPGGGSCVLLQKRGEGRRGEERGGERKKREKKRKEKGQITNLWLLCGPNQQLSAVDDKPVSCKC